MGSPVRLTWQMLGQVQRKNKIISAVKVDSATIGMGNKTMSASCFPACKRGVSQWYAKYTTKQAGK